MVELLQAIALMFVLEGLLPFAAPSRWRNDLLWIARKDDGQMRVYGLVMMMVGMLMIVLV